MGETMPDYAAGFQTLEAEVSRVIEFIASAADDRAPAPTAA